MKFSNRIVALYLTVVFFTGALIEMVSFLTIWLVVLPREPSFFFQSPSVTESDYKNYMQKRDPVLGWPAINAGLNPSFVHSRVIPSFPSPGGECISLYGDSFTYGDEVSDSEAWSNALSLRLGCRVANYGIGGYGTDQAYLRFRKNVADEAKVEILGIFPDNVLRNVNQYRYFLDARTIFSLKPRFIMQDGNLALIELPNWTYEEFLLATKRPNLVFQYETFLPDTSYGPVSLKSPYSLQLLKLLLSERVQSAVLGATSWEVFYQADHVTNALDITSEIAGRFAKESKARGKTPLIIIYPTGRSFKRYKETGFLVTNALVSKLERQGITYLDLHSAFAARFDSNKFCGLLTKAEPCTGHFNAAGNQVVADIVYEYLNEKLPFGHRA